MGGDGEGRRFRDNSMLMVSRSGSTIGLRLTRSEADTEYTGIDLDNNLELQDVHNEREKELKHTLHVGRY